MGEFSAGSRAGISGCVEDLKVCEERNESRNKNRPLARVQPYTCVRGSSSIGKPSGVRSDGEKEVSESQAVQRRSILVAVRLGYECDWQPKTSTHQASKSGHGGPRTAKNR